MLALSEVMVLLKSIGTHAEVVIKSTILPGTCKKLWGTYGIDVIHNPEFLTEAKAFEDFVNQDQIIIGHDIDTAPKTVALYQKHFPQAEIVETSTQTAELYKYTHNCFLATKVTFWNEIYQAANRCKANFDLIRDLLVDTGKAGSTHNKVPGPDGQFGYGGACLSPESLISTPRGLIQISDLKSGDAVYSKSGVTLVSQAGERFVSSKIKITSRGRKIEGSDDHIHFSVSDGDVLQEKLLKDFKVGDWVFIPQLKADFPHEIELGKIPNGHVKWWPENFKWSHDFAYAVGLWLADGCRNEGDSFSLSWTLGEAKAKVHERLISGLVNLGLNPYSSLKISNGTYGESRVNCVRVRSLGLTALLDTLGVSKLAHHKRIKRVPTEFIPSLVGGWLDGDGYAGAGSISGFSRSTGLIQDIDQLLLRVGICSNISKSGQQINISTREQVETVLKWTTRLSIENYRYVRQKPYASPNMRRVDGGWKTKVSKIEQTAGGKVVSLETEDQTYIAQGMLTHNCFPKDMAAFAKWSGSALIAAADLVNWHLRK